MRRYLAIVATSMLAVTAANASPMMIDPTRAGSSVDARITSSSCWGCYIDATLARSLNSAEAALHVGDSMTFDFFHIEGGGKLGHANVAVEATLALGSVGESVTATGHGGFVTILSTLTAGRLIWNHGSGSTISLGDGTFLGISFENLFEFGIGNTTTVSATIRRYASAASVPEPGTAALLVVGVLALWLATRRRPIGRRSQQFVSAA